MGSFIGFATVSGQGARAWTIVRGNWQRFPVISTPLFIRSFECSEGLLGSVLTAMRARGRTPLTWMQGGAGREVADALAGFCLVRWVESKVRKADISLEIPSDRHYSNPGQS